jgi:hypothetical protein
MSRIYEIKQLALMLRNEIEEELVENNGYIPQEAKEAINNLCKLVNAENE